ncbi:MAG: hypothetical protein ABIE03_04515 [Patescibacteria group bacterium]|nr:hypothetical protein [Patescibacteria group bacterium]
MESEGTRHNYDVAATAQVLQVLGVVGSPDAARNLVASEELVIGAGSVQDCVEAARALWYLAVRMYSDGNGGWSGQACDITLNVSGNGSGVADIITVNSSNLQFAVSVTGNGRSREGVTVTEQLRRQVCRIGGVLLQPGDILPVEQVRLPEQSRRKLVEDIQLRTTHTRHTNRNSLVRPPTVRMGGVCPVDLVPGISDQNRRYKRY